MSAAEDIEVISDKEDGDEMASLQLLEKRDCTKSIEETEGSVDLNSVNKDVRGTADVTNDESSETISKNTEEILLGNVAQEERETGDSDNQDEEMQLRWDDDELDEDDIKNEEELLGEGSSDTPKYPLSLQDEIIKTIEDEEKLLESEIDESKESPSDSTMDNMFVPKMDHNLNKPDIMLEIPSHELIEFSDDEEDLTNNLKMSPDMETDEEVSNANDIPMEEVQADIHKEAVSETPKEIIDENALEKEAKLAADILAKELNAMENDENVITGLTEINEEIHEDELLKDDPEEEKLLKEQTDKTDETFEIRNKVMEDIVKPASESQEDNIQEMEDKITDLCEEMLLATDENESEVDLENKDLKSESPVDIPHNITETKDVTDDSVKSKVVNTESNTVSKPPLTSGKELKINQTTSTESASNDNTETKIPDTVSLKETIKEKNVLDDPIIDPETKKSISDPQPSTSAIELETLQKESFENDIQTMENNSQEEITDTTEKADLKLQNDPSIDQSIKESVKQSDTKLQKNDIEAKDTLPSTSGNQEVEKSPELPITTDESVNETAVELPAQSIVDEPQPSTSFASDTKGPESSMFGSMMVQETSKDVPEMTDSLGLLAESSRVMEEDEEQEYDDDVEDEDDFDQDQDDVYLSLLMNENENWYDLISYYELVHFKFWRLHLGEKMKVKTSYPD
ncbi:unnamed protein product [Euphydryas editha]|uniref:Uncharacterized protein n=1 Tax=Euphydryas editha TaxID=104508 RepID=A0AAU9URU7_EUPED|nr:unnamed protein product [Euphydryas editha]